MKNIKKILVLMLVTSFTFLVSCSKDDNVQQPMKLGDIEISVDGTAFETQFTQTTVTDGSINEETGLKEDYLLMYSFNQKNSITVNLKKITKAGTYKFNEDSVVKYADINNAPKNQKVDTSGTFSTSYNTDANVGTITVSEYDRDKKMIKVEFEAIAKNAGGESKTIKGRFYKKFTLID